MLCVICVYGMGDVMKVYVAKYDDDMYPEDNKIVGVFISKASAERAVNDEIKFHYDTKHPNKHLGIRNYYSIEEQEVYD